MSILKSTDIELDINENRQLGCSARWHYTSSCIRGSEALAEVRKWAGTTGAPFRLPDDSPAGYSEADDLIVTAIEITPGRDDSSFIVNYRGIQKTPGAQLDGEITESIDSNGEVTRTARFIVTAETLLSFLPQVGAPLDWAGDAFVCESISSSRSEATGICEVTLTARKISLLMLGSPATSVSADGENIATADYFVGTEAYEEFMASLEIGGDASSWAGERFYIQSYSSQPRGNIGHTVSVTAREVATRMIDCIRSEKFAGFDGLQNPLREVTYTSVWRVHADDLESFDNQTGCSADWAGEDSIITSIEPRKISPVEYQLTMSADSRLNPNLHIRYSADDRSSLGSRIDLSVGVTEFHLTAEQCGYYYDDQNRLKEIDGWNHEAKCPFKASHYLLPAMVDNVLRTLRFTETRYYRHGLARNIARVETFLASKLYNGTVGGHRGVFRKEDIQADEIRDNDGLLWTRITTVYQLPPSAYEWNPTYCY